MSKPIAEWTDEELAAVILALLWRHQDEAGHSHGRSRTNALTEAVIDLLGIKLPCDPVDFPSDHVLIREADRRRLSRPVRTNPDFT